MIGVFANCEARRRISVLRSAGAAFESAVGLPFAPCQRVIRLANSSITQMNTTQFSHMHFLIRFKYPYVPLERSKHLYFKEESC